MNNIIMSNTITLTKGKGKCSPITIDSTVRGRIESFRQRLIQMSEQPDETSAFDVKSVDIIINGLDDYDRNLLLAYYAVAECSPTKLGNLIGIDKTIVSHKINRIIKYLKNHNDVPKSHLNIPRMRCDN
jgi:hypothetical protein